MKLAVNNSRDKRVGYMNLILCIILWASIPVATKKMLVELDNIQILFYSTVLSIIVMGIILMFQKKVKKLKNYSFKEYRSMCYLGFIGNFLYYIFLYGALERTTASEGFILAYTWPILVVVLSFFILKDKITMGKIIGLIVSFVGIIIITTKGNLGGFRLTDITGDALALLGAATFALFSVLGKKHNYDKAISVFMFFIAALIALLPTVIMFSNFLWPSMDTWKWLIYNGVFVNGITYVFWFNALEKLETHIASNVLYLTPFVSLIYIYMFLNERILISSVIGLFVIIAGIIIQCLFERIETYGRQ